MDYIEQNTTVKTQPEQYTPESTFHWNRPLAINYGLATGLAMILFTALMFFANPATAVFFRYANLFVMAAGAFLALKLFYAKFSRKETSYLSGLTMGMAVSVIGAAILSIFTFLMLSFGNAEIASTIVDLLPISNISPITLSLILCFETTLLGIVSSFIAMQFYKGNRDIRAGV